MVNEFELNFVFTFSDMNRTALGVHSGQVGLAIMSSISLVGFCEYGIRESTELENQMISVERIVEYSAVESEAPLESDEKKVPSKHWPTSANIEFKGLSLRYSENSPQILRNLSFQINGKVISILNSSF